MKYFYDGDGLRVSRTDNLTIPPKTTYYVWDTENPTGYPQVIEEIEGGQVVRRYGYGHFLENVDIWNGSAFDRFYVVRDGTNSVRMLLDSAGNVVAEYDYDAFGNVLRSTINDSISTQNSFGFHSEYRDPATGLVYLRARWYEPREGRFLCKDEFEGENLEPQSLNKYVFTVNNPTNNIDPLGKTTWPTESYTISSYFGWRALDDEELTFHSAIDIDQYGTSGKVYAADSGVVYATGKDKKGTNYIIVKENKTGFYQGYWHTKNIWNLKSGEKVYEGLVIGQSDMSGKTTGLHLHFTMEKILWDTNSRFNPLPHLEGAPLPNLRINNEPISEFVQRYSRGGLKPTSLGVSGVTLLYIGF